MTHHPIYSKYLFIIIDFIVFIDVIDVIVIFSSVFVEFVRG